MPSSCETGGGGGDGDAARPLPPAALTSAFRRCVLAVAPLLRCATLPPCHAANFAEWSARRAAVVESFRFRPPSPRRWLPGGLGFGRAPGVAEDGGASGVSGGRRQRGEARHPVEPLSALSGGQWLHRPFDASEVRLEVGGPAAPWLAV
jgi:hypothetical protein